MVSQVIQQALFKYNLAGDTAIIKMAERDQQLIETVFSLMGNTVPRPMESNKALFNRVYKNHLASQIAKKKSTDLSDSLKQWSDDTKKAQSNGFRATPEQLKALLDNQLDVGEISQQQYDWGMKGIDFLPGLLAQEEEEIGV